MEQQQYKLPVLSNKNSSPQSFVLPPLPTNVVSKFVTVYGVKIHYLEAGSGPVLILLHGLGMNSSAWAANIGSLSTKYRLIIPDQVGSGLSDKPLINYSVSTLVDFLGGFYKELGVEYASLIGSSLGSWVATAFALANPEKVKSLVLLCPFTVLQETDLSTLDVLNPSTREGMRRLLSLAFYNKEVFTSDAAVDYFFAGRISSGDGYTIQRLVESFGRREDVFDNRLNTIKKPILIIAGQEDKVAPLVISEWLNKQFQGSELLVMEECAHGLQLEKPDEFNAAVMNFI